MRSNSNVYLKGAFQEIFFGPLFVLGVLSLSIEKDLLELTRRGAAGGGIAPWCRDFFVVVEDQLIESRSFQPFHS